MDVPQDQIELMQQEEADVFKKYSNVIDILSVFSITVPSLQHLTVNKVAGCLWNQKDVHDLLQKTWASLLLHEVRRWGVQMGPQQQIHWKAVEDLVMSNLSKLQVPRNLQRAVLDCFDPMCADIKYWIYFHSDVMVSTLPDLFCWSRKGTIDFGETARSMVHSSVIPIEIRFRIACLHCMEDDIRSLFPKLDPFWLGETYNESMLVLLWKSVLDGTFSKFIRQSGYSGRKNLSEYGFSCAADCGSESAILYFIKTLDQDRKSEVIFKNMKHIFGSRPHSPDILLILFPLMSRYHKVTWLDENKWILLQCFLQWHWREFFIQVADYLWGLISMVEYLRILQDIARKVKEFPHCYSYHNIFRDFWLKSPMDYKKYAFSKCLEGCLLALLFKRDCDAGAKLIIESAPSELRNKIIFAYGGLIACDCLIQQRKWKTLEVFILTCVLDVDTFIRFEKIYWEHLSTERRLSQVELREVTEIFRSLMNVLKSQTLI